MEVHNPAVSNLKCPTCNIDFNELQKHKDHYKSDYHRYNLKRKMVKLAPVTHDQFIAKKAYEAEQDNTPDFKCGQCGKKFASSKTFDQHVTSKNHDPKKIPTESPSPKKPIVPFSKNPLLCLFCLAASSTFTENLRHMQSSHSFFIAQPQFCTNPQGLVEYLQQKIEIGFMCILCENKNAKDFNTGEAVRKHMNDKGHFFMKVQDGYDQYLKFYDFSTQFRQIVQEQKDRYVPGIQYTTLEVVDKNGQQQPQEQGNQQDWEDQEEGQEEQIKQKDGDEQWQSDQQQDQQQCQKQAQSKPQKQVPSKVSQPKTTTYHIMRPTHTPTGQLLLPNGKILGHRKYRHIYRQTLRPFWYNSRVKMLSYAQPSSDNNALICKKRLMELVKEDKIAWKAKNRWDRIWVHNGVKNNDLQKYFRIQNSM